MNMPSFKYCPEEPNSALSGKLLWASLLFITFNKKSESFLTRKLTGLKIYPEYPSKLEFEVVAPIKLKLLVNNPWESSKLELLRLTPALQGIRASKLPAKNSSLSGRKFQLIRISFSRDPLLTGQLRDFSGFVYFGQIDRFLSKNFFRFGETIFRLTQPPDDCRWTKSGDQRPVFQRDRQN